MEVLEAILCGSNALRKTPWCWASMHSDHHLLPNQVAKSMSYGHKHNRKPLSIRVCPLIMSILQHSGHILRTKAEILLGMTASYHQTPNSMTHPTINSYAYLLSCVLALPVCVIAKATSASPSSTKDGNKIREAKEQKKTGVDEGLRTRTAVPWRASSSSIKVICRLVKWLSWRSSFAAVTPLSATCAGLSPSLLPPSHYLTRLALLIRSALQWGVPLAQMLQVTNA